MKNRNNIKPKDSRRILRHFSLQIYSLLAISPFVYFRYDTPYDTDMTVVRIAEFFC